MLIQSPDTEFLHYFQLILLLLSKFLGKEIFYSVLKFVTVSEEIQVTTATVTHALFLQFAIFFSLPANIIWKGVEKIDLCHVSSLLI